MRISGLAIAVLAAACFHPAPPSGAPCSLEGDCPSGLACIAGVCGGGVVTEDAPRADAPDGALADAQALDAAGCQSFSTQFDTCGMTFTGDYVVAGSITYNTDTHVFSNAQGVVGKLVAGGSGLVDVVAFKTFSVPFGATLRVLGSHPFAIAASEQIQIAGTLDLVGGAGARPTCSAMTGLAASSGGSGGGGGGFRGAGGNGGLGDHGGANVPGGMGGGVQSLPQGPLGGCAGGGGGMGGLGSSAAGGVGGGAVYLVAGASVQVDGAVNAGGAGGGGGPGPNAGGGGGGSGGMILVEAPAVTVAGALAANGGGGGGGADIAAAGKLGDAGNPNATAAGGGTSAGNGSPGGNGSSGFALSGTTVTAQPIDGGGGGGGGAGFIAIASPAPNISGVVSPPRSSWP